jgi:hypothetical protein
MGCFSYSRVAIPIISLGTKTVNICCCGHDIGSFVGEGPDIAKWVIDGDRPDFIICNPPFNLAIEFVERSFEWEPKIGIYVLVRSNWAEGCDRYKRLFSIRRPTVIAQFVERVPMVKGRWDPNATTATSYAWFGWSRRAFNNHSTEFMWIPPGCRKALTKPDDAEKFG